MTVTPIRFSSVDALIDPEALGSVAGPVARIERERLSGLGASGSYHERLTLELRSGTRRRLMLKHIDLDEDFTVYRTGARVSREVALLSETSLDGIWQIFSCPYLAFAEGGGRVALLKEDVSAYLLPDMDEPIAQDEEDRLLTALARLHARYWESDRKRLPWLTSPTSLFGLLGPHAAAEESRRASQHPLLQVVARGWQAAFARLPEQVAQSLSQPADLLAQQCEALPQTVLHGDTKVGNFALPPDGTVVAFDWALMGFGPATLDLGWYLAVNAGRLAQPKDSLIDRYRILLEKARGVAFPDRGWQRMVWVGVLYGALMSLWEKALSVEAGAAGAGEEWEWWVNRLQRQ